MSAVLNSQTQYPSLYHFSIIGFNYQRLSDDSVVIDIKFQGNHQDNSHIIKHYRFFNPREIEIEKGFPASGCGWTISDISSYGWEKIKIRFYYDEASWGGCSFIAEDFVELDHSVSP